MIDYKLYLHRVEVLPTVGSVSNVVKRVIWAIEFFDSEYPEICRSIAGVETLLETEYLTNAAYTNNFIAIEDLSHSQIIEWCFTMQGGEAFIEEIRPVHEANIFELRNNMNYKVYDLDLLVQE